MTIGDILKVIQDHLPEGRFNITDDGEITIETGLTVSDDAMLWRVVESPETHSEVETVLF